MATVNMKQGDKSLTVQNATFEGVSALEHLGWKLDGGKKPARVKRAPKAAAPDADAIRAEVEEELRAEIEAAVRAEVQAEQDAAQADKKEAEKAPAKK